MTRTPVFRRPDPSDACATPAVIRGFTVIKLLILLILAGSLILIPRAPGIVAPGLDPAPATILAGELRLTGQGTPGASVEVLANDRILGSDTVDRDGRWEVSASFTAGAYRLLAQAVFAGNERLADDGGEAELAVVDRPTLELSAPRMGGAAAEVTLFGAGTPGSTLRLTGNEESIATIQVGTAGNWEEVLASLPVPSETVFVVHVVDGTEAILGSSEPRSLSLFAPAPLAIERTIFGHPARSDRLNLVDGDLQVSGTGEPGAQVTLWRNGVRITAAATVGADGTWTTTTSQSLRPGEHPFGARMTTPGGQLLAEKAFAVTVPAPPTLAADGGETDVDDVLLSGTSQPQEALTLYVNDGELDRIEADESGQWQYTTRLKVGSHRILARANSGLDSDPAEVKVALARPRITGQSRDEAGNAVPGFFGEGRPNVALEILEGDSVIGQARVDAGGRWVCTCTLAPGEHTVSVREADEPERSSQPLTITVANPVPAFVPGPAVPEAPPFRCPDPSPPGVVEGQIYSVGCGESLSLIATRLGSSVDALLAHNPQLSDPARVYFGQRLNVPAGAACLDPDGD